MHFERVTDANHPMYEKALALYRESFPMHEQRLPASQKRILGDMAYHFGLIWDEAVFVGLILYWETQTYQYVEHFCILPSCAGGNMDNERWNNLGGRGKRSFWK